MRKESIEYIKDLPIKLELVNIMDYPMHWKDSIEILFVIEGSIDVYIESDVYTLREREIEIINKNEIYSIKSQDKNNKVLVLDIDPSFFERYYDPGENIFFYTNSLEGNNQDDEKYERLREYISIILYETVSKMDDYEDEIEENLLNMMYLLLNSFHYLFYEEESLREDKVQLERYHRIISYLRANYMNKVSLQEIAEREYLSPQYLSYKIKDTFGQSFNDFLNGIRVEESRRLLLNTDKNILEISEEVGFSHVRYYNKHFKNRYSYSPLEYRNKYKVTDEQFEAMKDIRYLQIDDAVSLLKDILEDYDRYDYDNKIIKLYIDMEKEEIGSYERPLVIDLGDISFLLEEENRNKLKEIQEEIRFTYCIMNNLFSKDMDIYRGKNNRFINWTRVENILVFLKEVKLKPVINIARVERYIVDEFVSYFEPIFGSEVHHWIEPRDIGSFNLVQLEDEVNPMYDSLFMVPYIIYNYIHNGKKIMPLMIDEISSETILDNDTFFGGNGIITSSYLKKPSYYVYMLLSLLGEKILYKEDGFVVTESKSGIEILVYNPIELNKDISFEDLYTNKIKERKLSINFINMDVDYKITKYELNKHFGSVYDKWRSLGEPERLSNNYWDLLDEFVHPNISFHYGKKAIVYNIISKLQPFGATLFTLEKVLNDD